MGRMGETATSTTARAEKVGKLPSWVAPVVIGILILSTASALWGMATSLGKISVLTVQADTAAAVTVRALLGEAEARAGEATAKLGEAEAKLALSESFEAAAQERVEATLRQAEAQATLIIQEAEGEAAFRRLTGYLESKDDLVGVRLAEEMDGEFRVQGMLADDALDVSASSLLIAQNRIVTFEVQVDSLISAHDETQAAHDVTLAAHERTNAANAAEHAIKDQIIEEQQRARFPSFFQKIFDMPEVALAGATAGVLGCLFFCP